MTAAEAVGAYDKNFWLVHGFRISLMMMLSALDALSMVIKEKGFAAGLYGKLSQGTSMPKPMSV